MEASRTCGIEHINGALRTAEIQWEELREVLAQRETEASLREQQQFHLEELNDMAIRWLQEMDARLRKLTPAALDLTVISQQIESLEVFQPSSVTTMLLTVQLNTLCVNVLGV